MNTPSLKVINDYSRDQSVFRFFKIDWLLLVSAVLISIAGLVTMNSFTGENSYFDKQVIWISISIMVFFAVSLLDFRFLRRTSVVVSIFALSVIILLVLMAVGSVTKGAKSWFHLGFFSFQPADFIKFAVIIVLAKYFSRRHIEISNVKHILVSGAYVFIIFVMVMAQPDFGSAIIIFFLWLGMVLISGISKKHLMAVFLIGAILSGGLWFYVFKDYQKKRIMTFVYPLTDVRGAGYNAYQSMIAVGSGQLLGKGIGYGTQSKLKFLPEYQTDFIFAAYSEEWGFLGVIMLFSLYGILMWRIISNAYRGATNFEILYGAGLAILFMSHFIINVGMNIGLLPVTGITLPFMSYGGTHMLASFIGLGILMGMRRYRMATHRDVMKNEFLGL
ncbi:MAG: rod shape-determining protein RodA [Patescibacteria group bacterium]